MICYIVVEENVVYAFDMKVVGLNAVFALHAPAEVAVHELVQSLRALPTEQAFLGRPPLQKYLEPRRPIPHRLHLLRNLIGTTEPTLVPHVIELVRQRTRARNARIRLGARVLESALRFVLGHLLRSVVGTIHSPVIVTEILGVALRVALLQDIGEGGRLGEASMPDLVEGGEYLLVFL